MRIRPADQNDIDTLVSILRGSFAGVAERYSLTEENCPRHVAFSTAEEVRKNIENGMQFYVLEADGEVCGCVALQPAKPGVAYLGRLAVVPEYRNRGFGKALVGHLFGEAEKTGVTRVEIGLIAEDKALGEWYGQFGFTPTTTKKIDGFPFAVAFMAKDL